MDEIIKIQNISKVFQKNKAVKDVSFTIQKGEVVAILGPNGAGKTTTISILLGLMKPTSGKVELFHSDPQSRKVRERIGTMLQEVSVVQNLKVIEVLDLIRNYYPDPLPLQDVVTLTGLSDADLKTRAEKLSGGQKRRLSFALALSGNQDLLILDEPTVGMDIASRNRFWKTIHLLAEQGKTIIFTTHYLQEADDTAQRILLFNNGEIIADGSPSDIKRKISKQLVTCRMDASAPIERLSQFPFIKTVELIKGHVHISTEDTDKVLAVIMDKQFGAQDIQIVRGKLDEAFEQLTSPEKEAI